MYDYKQTKITGCYKIVFGTMDLASYDAVQQCVTFLFTQMHVDKIAGILEACKRAQKHFDSASNGCYSQP